jgi:hypothetical protein
MLLYLASSKFELLRNHKEDQPNTTNFSFSDQFELEYGPLGYSFYLTHKLILICLLIWYNYIVELICIGHAFYIFILSWLQFLQYHFLFTSPIASFTTGS